ncbi:amino acid ABC transporter permease [Enterococcus sp. AZ072]|uniref:amino acid ABC transporter permease n=1 Tax=unclassified Enterococcus TaxID=2608891 RepID=UPI003D2970A1
MSSNFFSWERFVHVFPQVLQKLPVTFQIVVIATIIGLLLGTLLAVIRIKRIPVLNQLAYLMISFFRGTPALVQMFIVYYGMPLLFRSYLNMDLSGVNKIFFVFITFGLNQAGYMAELIRASILSVPIGQTEAGYSVGLTGWQTFYRIVFPQALKVAIPGLETLFVMLLQDTALAYMIGVADMMGKVRMIAATTRHSIEGYIGVAIIFAAISLILEGIFAVVNHRSSRRKKVVA